MTDEAEVAPFLESDSNLIAGHANVSGRCKFVRAARARTGAAAVSQRAPGAQNAGHANGERRLENGHRP